MLEDQGIGSLLAEKTRWCVLRLCEIRDGEGHTSSCERCPRWLPQVVVIWMDLGPRWAGVSRDDAIGYPSGARLASGPERNAAVSWQIAYTKAEFPEAISARTVPSVQRNALVWTRRFSVNHQHTSGIRYPRQRDLSLRWRRNGEGKSKQAVVREYLIILEPSPKHWSTTPQAPHGSTKSAAGCRTDLTAASA